MALLNRESGSAETPGDGFHQGAAVTGLAGYLQMGCLQAV